MASAGGTHAATSAASGATAEGGAAAISSAPDATTAYIRILLEIGPAMSSPRDGRSTDGRSHGDLALSPRLELPVARPLQAARQNLQRDTGPGDSGFRYGAISCKPKSVETNPSSKEVHKHEYRRDGSGRR